MYCYAAIAGVTQKRQFIYDIESISIDKLVVKDKFTTQDSTKSLWGLAKFQNRVINPYFNNDPASCIINRYQVARVPSLTHRLPTLFTKEILEQKKKNTFQNMCLSLYAMASMNYYEQEYFESVFFAFLDTDATPQVDQLAYIAQACATLRRSEYTSQLLQWFV
jgi:hypothetical protein